MTVIDTVGEWWDRIKEDDTMFPFLVAVASVGGLAVLVLLWCALNPIGNCVKCWRCLCPRCCPTPAPLPSMFGTDVKPEDVATSAQQAAPVMGSPGDDHDSDSTAGPSHADGRSVRLQATTISVRPAEPTVSTPTRHVHGGGSVRGMVVSHAHEPQARTPDSKFGPSPSRSFVDAEMGAGAASARRPVSLGTLTTAIVSFKSMQGGAVILSRPDGSASVLRAGSRMSVNAHRGEASESKLRLPRGASTRHVGQRLNGDHPPSPVTPGPFTAAGRAALREQSRRGPGGSTPVAPVAAVGNAGTPSRATPRESAAPTLTGAAGSLPHILAPRAPMAPPPAGGDSPSTPSMATESPVVDVNAVQPASPGTGPSTPPALYNGLRRKLPHSGPSAASGRTQASRTSTVVWGSGRSLKRRATADTPADDRVGAGVSDRTRLGQASAHSSPERARTPAETDAELAARLQREEIEAAEEARRQRLAQLHQHQTSARAPVAVAAPPAHVASSLPKHMQHWSVVRQHVQQQQQQQQQQGLMQQQMLWQHMVQASMQQQAAGYVVVPAPGYLQAANAAQYQAQQAMQYQLQYQMQQQYLQQQSQQQAYMAQVAAAAARPAGARTPEVDATTGATSTPGGGLALPPGPQRVRVPTKGVHGSTRHGPGASAMFTPVPPRTNAGPASPRGASPDSPGPATALDVDAMWTQGTPGGWMSVPSPRSASVGGFTPASRPALGETPSRTHVAVGPARAPSSRRRPPSLRWGKPASEAGGVATKGGGAGSGKSQRKANFSGFTASAGRRGGGGLLPPVQPVNVGALPSPLSASAAGKSFT